MLQVSPSTLSFFPIGKTPRPEQASAIQEIDARFAAGSRIVAFQGPTGIGKSYVAASFFRKAAAFGQNVHCLTAQRALMDQYTLEFPSPEIEPIKGRSNYACTLEPWRPNAAGGYCRSKERAALVGQCLKEGTVEQAMRFELPPRAHACPYWKQLATCVDAPVTLYNFHSFLFQQRLGRFGVRDLMVLDECHNTENVLLQFVQIVVSSYALDLIHVDLDLDLKTPEQVLAWLDREQIDRKIKDALGDAAETEDAAKGLSPEDTDSLRSLFQKIKDLRRFFDMTKWVVDVTEEGEDGARDRTRKLRVRPVFVAPFAKELVFSKADRVLAMSATVLNPDIWARNLGIPKGALSYVEAPCPFPVKNRQIFLEYAGDMGWKNQPATLPKLYAAIGRVLDRHRGLRGIIHGHSERLCRLILENVRSSRFLHLGQFKDRDKSALLKAHAARPDSVIVGSGFHEGVDLKDDLARFAVIAKVPWPMMEDAFVKARMAEDKWYMAYQTSLKLIQSAGRTVRHEKDFSKTFLLDAGFEHFMKQAAWLLPKWFIEAIQRPSK